jgi:hypothetical protein
MYSKQLWEPLDEKQMRACVFNSLYFTTRSRCMNKALVLSIVVKSEGAITLSNTEHSHISLECWSSLRCHFVNFEPDRKASVLYSLSLGILWLSVGVGPKATTAAYLYVWSRTCVLLKQITNAVIEICISSQSYEFFFIESKFCNRQMLCFNDCFRRNAT